MFFKVMGSSFQTLGAAAEKGTFTQVKFCFRHNKLSIVEVNGSLMMAS